MPIPCQEANGVSEGNPFSVALMIQCVWPQIDLSLERKKKEIGRGIGSEAGNATMTSSFLLHTTGCLHEKVGDNSAGGAAGWLKRGCSRLFISAELALDFP